MSQIERLYSPELLALTVRLAEYPWAADFPFAGEARSKSCGSTLTLGLSLAADGSVDRIGLRVRACAVGQASAAIFADAVAGADLAAIRTTRNAMAAWLSGSGPLPDWPGIAALEPAHGYPGRHGAMMLPWDAALAALSTDGASG